MKKKYGFVLIAAILLASCGQKKETKTTTSRPVRTAIVESRSIIRKDFSGIVEAVEYVNWHSVSVDRSFNCPSSREKK